jgi:thiamine transport system substrate-binding protein
MIFLRKLAGLAASLPILVLPTAQAAVPQLTVYTYASFVSEWGPGPLIEQAFEKHCNCDLKFVGLEDGGALLSRLKLEGKRTAADVILGLDTALTGEAEQTGLLQEHNITLGSINLALPWSDLLFVPYDFGYFGFVYDSETLPTPPGSLEELVHDRDGPRIIIQDPRTSTPGLGLLLWMRKVFGTDDQAAWTALAPRIVTVTKGWSEAYGLFLKGEAPMVLSYTTSPAYHRQVEQNNPYQVAMFSEGHYRQVEVAARLSTSSEPQLAQNFLRFLLSDTVQNILPTTNWMLPSVHTGQGLPDAFRDEEVPERMLQFDSLEVRDQRKQWISRWLIALSR